MLGTVLTLESCCKMYAGALRQTLHLHRPLSKRKAFVLTEIIHRARVFDAKAAAAAVSETNVSKAAADRGAVSMGFAASAL